MYPLNFPNVLLDRETTAGRGCGEAQAPLEQQGKVMQLHNWAPQRGNR